MIENDRTIFPPNGGIGYDEPAPVTLIDAPAPAPAYDTPEPVGAAPVEVRASSSGGASGGVVANAPKVSQGGAQAPAAPSAGPATADRPLGGPRVAPGASAGLKADPGATAPAPGARVNWWAVGLGSLALAAVLWFVLADREDKGE